MSKILYSLYSSFLFISLTTSTVTVYSQNVVDNSNINFPATTINKIHELGTVTVIDVVGDIECSRNLHDQLKNDIPTLFIALGDLCYEPDLSNFTNLYSDFKKANKLSCVIGNHESDENGNLKILNEVRLYCGDHWYRKIANNTTLLIGLNTNGNTSLQINWAQSLVTTSSFMKEIKNVMLLSHKPAHMPPGSDHLAENSTIQMFSAIENNISKNIELYEIAAHNHIMDKSTNGHWFVSGAGGKAL